MDHVGQIETRPTDGGRQVPVLLLRQLEDADVEVLGERNLDALARRVVGVGCSRDSLLELEGLPCGGDAAEYHLVGLVYLVLRHARPDQHVVERGGECGVDVREFRDERSVLAVVEILAADIRDGVRRLQVDDLVEDVVGGRFVRERETHLEVSDCVALLAEGDLRVDLECIDPALRNAPQVARNGILKVGCIERRVTVGRLDVDRDRRRDVRELELDLDVRGPRPLLADDYVADVGGEAAKCVLRHDPTWQPSERLAVVLGIESCKNVAPVAKTAVNRTMRRKRGHRRRQDCSANLSHFLHPRRPTDYRHPLLE